MNLYDECLRDFKAAWAKANPEPELPADLPTPKPIGEESE